MSLSKICAVTLVAVGLSLAAAAPARAALVNWDVDASQSFARITIPDFAYDTGVIGTITIRPRNVGGGPGRMRVDVGRSRRHHLDQSGRRSKCTVSFRSEQFVRGRCHERSVRIRRCLFPMHPSRPKALTATARLLRPRFSPRSYQQLSGQTLGFMAMRNINFDIASGAIAPSGGTGIAASSTSLGVDCQVGLDVTAASPHGFVARSAFDPRVPRCTRIPLVVASRSLARWIAN